MRRARAQGVFTVGPVGNGHVSIGPRPMAEGLDDWCDALRMAGVHHVVSLIEDSEVARYGLADEDAVLAENGIGFERFPVDDFDIPDAGAFQNLITALSEKLASGKHVFLHCAGGVGRAGTTASCLLIAHGWQADQAMKDVSAARGEKCPETIEQVAFIRRFNPLQP
ncbi:hypothetical protein ACFQ14_11160 [Pseudahrensia aquimaris]|uniref:Tyrosine specific protein phosphatases domain-containing protein n=1 Tax=Pseudahrensia aquimaris TaxID=744461 RepID=A0ABW3FEQ8_9HYPH